MWVHGLLGEYRKTGNHTGDRNHREDATKSKVPPSQPNGNESTLIKPLFTRDSHQ
jgi:hypothetical protein